MLRKILFDGYVVGERVTPYGTFGVHGLNVPPPLEYDPWEGLVLFNPSLIGKDPIKAELVAGDLTLLDNDGLTFSHVTPGQLLIVEKELSGKNEVMAGGWLTLAWSHRWSATQLGRRIIKRKRESLRLLRAVERGTKAYSSRALEPFYVRTTDLGYQRRIVMLLALQAGDSAEIVDFQAIDKDGEDVPLEIHFPFPKVWVKLPPANLWP